jgi:hypothetical protein
MREFVSFFFYFLIKRVWGKKNIYKIQQLCSIGKQHSSHRSTPHAHAMFHSRSFFFEPESGSEEEGTLGEREGTSISFTKESSGKQRWNWIDTYTNET